MLSKNSVVRDLWGIWIILGLREGGCDIRVLEVYNKTHENEN